MNRRWSVKLASQFIDHCHRRARVLARSVGRDASRAWRRARAHPSQTLAAAVALVLVVSLVAVGTLPEVRRAVRGAVAAAPKAKPKPKVGELPERATATSTTRRNANGSYTTTLYSAPVNYRGSDGAYHRIDTSLHPDGRDGYAWRSDANAFTARFKPSLDGAYTEYTVAGHTFRTSAVGASAGTARQSGSTVRYPGAFPNADLTYTVGASGVKEVIDLANAAAPTSYSFRISHTGKGAQAVLRQKDGSYRVSVPGVRGPAYVLAAPTVTESAPAHRLARPDAAARPTLSVTAQGKDLLVTIGLSAAWLHAPGRSFPVHLDPTMTVQTDDQDAVFNATGTSPLSTSTNLSIGADSKAVWRSAVQFSFYDVPAGAQVSDAKLGLYYDGTCISIPGKSCGTSAHTIDVHRVTSAWDYLTSTSDMMHYDATTIGSYTLPAGAPPGWMTWPVTDAVRGWLSGATVNYGLLLARQTEPLGSGGPAPLSRWSYTGQPNQEPKLDLTYTEDGGALPVPATVHANGADLSWTKYTGTSSGAPFSQYEVHRSLGSADFAPSASTLLATIRDQSITTYRDTTAAPGKAFTYKIVTNGTASYAQTVTTPASGQARKTLQPDGADGDALDISTEGYCTGSRNGASESVLVGADAGGTWRGLIHFDLRDIPPAATVTAATASVWEEYGPTAQMTVEAHRLTRPFTDKVDDCSDTWNEYGPGQRWTTPGGDFDPTAAATVAVPSGDQNVFRDFPITGLVQHWVDGSQPNNGILLRASDESLVNYHRVYFASDDYFQNPALRPVLNVTYSEGSAAVGPTVSMSSPAPGATVAGTAAMLSAAASDDGKVSKVEFLVDGAVVGSASAAPWQVSWNSTGAGLGTHSITARATDDAGQQTTSSAVSVTVDNTGTPTGAVSAPAASAGSVTLSATATAQGSKAISSVAFLVDGVQVGAPDTTSPYSITWNTADPLLPFFNGSHQVAASITDSNGLVGVSPAMATTVNNTGTTTSKAGFTLNNPTDTTDDAFPPSMGENTATGVPVQDPYSGTNARADGTSGGSLNRALADAPQNDLGTPLTSCPVNAYCPTVNVTNTSGSTWTSSTAQVWYRWYAPNGAVMYEGKSSTAFPATFANNAVQAFPLVVYPPALPPGVQRGTFRLRIDIWNPATSTWFSTKGNQPIDNPVIVAKALSTKLGLERFYQYDGGSLGAGASDLVNVANGDLIARWSPMFNTGRGLSTMVDLTYNSLEDHSSSPAGNSVSLSMSGLARLGEPIDIHPNKADTISGRSNKWIEVTDGDGSTHHFDGVTGTDGVTRWTEPAGVNLYLRAVGGSDPNRVWAFTRPDKVTYYYDADGFPTSVEDRNGNKITYTYEDTPSGEDPGGPKKRITTVTDAGGRSFTIAYWSKAEIKKAHVRGKIKTIIDHNGSVLKFDYYDDGNLLRLTQVGGANADGSYLADRTMVFTYTTSKGDAPAIGAAGSTGTSARLNPDPKTPNESTRLYSVIDARQHETTFAYYLATDGAQLRWKLKSRTDRDGQTTSYAYDLTNRITTVTAPLSRVTAYGYDTSGRVTSIVNAKNETTGVIWTADNKVTQVTEPTGKYTGYTYNANGYLLTKADELGHTTALTYTDSGVDANDTGKHLSLLATVTTPNGVATATPTTDYQTRYTYDSAGNPDKVTDPTGAVTDYDYNLAGSANPGTLAAVTAPNGVATATPTTDYKTTYPAYDPSGQPTQVVDPLGHTTTVGYDPDGRVLWVQDPNHASDSGTDTRSYRSYFSYDTFGRLGRQSSPKSSAMDRGRLLVSAVTFDPNDNAVTQAAPGYSTPGPVARTTFDVMDRPTLITGPDTNTDPAGERTQIDYDAAGRTSKVTKPRGVQTSTVADDYATVFGYDLLDRVVSQTQYGQPADAARRTQMCYDTAGDLRSVTAPRAGTATITCPGNGPYTGAYTTRMDYYDNHRLRTQTDPLGHATRTTYDFNDNVTATETDITTGRVQRTEIDYDQRDKPVVQRERFDGATGRNATTRVEYDADGNTKRVISPRGYDTGGASGPWTYYVTVNDYDQADRPVRTTLPYNSSDGTERQYVHTHYDANGNTLATSLPVTQSDATLVAAAAKTTMTYFDPGWIRTSNDPANPTVHFDYTATGKQASRTPELKSSPGTLDTAKTQTWTYWPDDMLKAQSDKGGHPASYSYDADNNTVTASDDGGVTDPSQGTMLTEATFNGFDEVTKTRHKKQQDSTWTFSDYQYDQNGNTTVRRENGEEDTAGTQSTAPRRYELDYDGADWLTEQRDLGVDSGCDKDTKTDTTFWGTGWEKQRDTYRENASCTWSKKKTTTWTHFDNGKLRTLTTTNGAGTTTETHTVSYYDTGNVYVDGNRTKDTQGVTRGTGSTATTCTPTSPCDALYVYDARDKLISESRNGAATTYTLDQPVDQLADASIRAGNVTTQTTAGVATTQRYTGTQLTDTTTGGATAKYWYDDEGNQDCLTTSAGTRANCNTGATSVSATVLADYHYDYLNRVDTIQQYAAGAQTDKASYIYDALDRTTRETEDHSGTGNDRTTDFTYQGMSTLLTQEKQSGGTSPKTKTYSYDNYGHKLGMTSHDNGTGTDTPYSYGTDVHGSISQLIDDAGSVKASYGYTAYGGADTAGTQSLTAGDTDNQNPLNPMRFSGRRADSGTATASSKQPDYDMGARRYGPGTGRFLQRDAYDGALANLGLATDPLTQNRYALAGGNPISYVESDGHVSIPDGGGSGATTPSPSAATRARQAECRTSSTAADNCVNQDRYNRVRATYLPIVPAAPGDVRKVYPTKSIAPGSGIILARFYIKEETAAFGQLAGDKRNATPAPDARYRIAVAWDAETGQVSYSVTQSCSPGWTKCVSQKKIKPGGANNLQVTAEGPNKLSVKYSGINSKIFCCAVSGTIDVQLNGNDSRVRLTGDYYPDVEIYQYSRNGVRSLGSTTSGRLDGSRAAPPFLNRDVSWINGQLVPEADAGCIAVECGGYAGGL